MQANCVRIALIILGGLFAQASRAENWPAWRGPRGDGTTAETAVPLRWSPTENLAWKTELPGGGHASPIVWGNRIFTVTALPETEQRVLLCLDRDHGMIRWQRPVITAPLEQIHRLNSYASSTPATNGELVYVAFLDVDKMVVAAYDFDGNRRWLVRPGAFSSVHGFCSSPVLYEDKVIVNGDHDGDAYLVALDRQTGRTLWKTPRQNKTRSYCTPIIREIDGRTQMLLSGSLCVASYDPDNGRRHWILDGPTEQFVASLVYAHGLVFVTGGYPDFHILAIRPDGHGHVTDAQVAWHETGGAAYVPSPIALGDYFLIVSDTGIASCFDAVSGKRFWMHRMVGRHYSASLIAADGLVYFLSDQGIMTVVKPGPQFDVMAQNEIGERCFASPAVSDGRLFLRGETHLFCIANAAAATARR